MKILQTAYTAEGSVTHPQGLHTEGEDQRWNRRPMASETHGHVTAKTRDIGKWRPPNRLLHMHLPGNEDPSTSQSHWVALSSPARYVKIVATTFGERKEVLHLLSRKLSKSNKYIVLPIAVGHNSPGPARTIFIEISGGSLDSYS